MHRLSISGPTFYIAHLSQFLKDDFEILLVAGALEADEADGSYLLNHLPRSTILLPEMGRSILPIKDYKAIKQLRNIIKKFKPDIVHTHAAKAGAIGRLAAILESVPIILHTFHGHTFHSYFGGIKTAIFRYIERLLARRCKAIIAISPRQKEELANIYHICSANKINVIPLGLNLNRFQQNIVENRFKFRKEFHISDTTVAIGTIGRLTKIKNHNFFLNSLKIALSKTTVDVKVFIVGDGEERETLECLVIELNLSSIVHFTSWRFDIEVVIAGLDIVALSSLNEGTPLVIFEAQASGKPVISTRVGGISDIVLDNKTALLVDSENTQQYADGLIKLIEDNNLRSQMGVDAMEWIQSNFDSDKNLLAVKNLYNNLLQN
jgi:glycosyltransferase involved in cell wall biosynthesis